MRSTVIGFTAMLVVVMMESSHAQTIDGPDDRFRISLSINGIAVQGEQELAAAAIGKSVIERRALQDAAIMSVQRNSSFQLIVTVTQPDGTVANLTSSPRLLYESFGCMTVSPAGFLTITPSGPCKGGDVPTLWIAYTAPSGQPITYNAYQFRVVD